MAKANLTAARLREMLDYDPATGIFTQKTTTGARYSAGRATGNINGDGYVSISVTRDKFTGHRLAWLYVHGEWPKGHIDHINGVRHDNRIENLREASQRKNSENFRRPNANSTTGFLGVTRTATGKYMAQIKTALAGHEINLYLGCHETPERAHEVYLAAKRLLHPGCTI